VGSLVEGSVQSSNGRIRLTVELIDAGSGARLGGTTLDRPMGELFLLEDDLAQHVAATLRRRVGQEVRMRERLSATRNARARELVWRADRLGEEADSLAASQDTLELRHSLVMTRRADSLLILAQRADDKWIEPIVERGWLALHVALHQTDSERNAAFDSSLAFANRALSREPSNPSALELRGTSRYYRADRDLVDPAAVPGTLAQAGSDLERAIESDSARASAWGTLSRVRRALGDVADAERLANTALSMDAYLQDAPSILLALFSATLMNDRLESSTRWCRRGASMFPADVSFITCQLTLLAENGSHPPDVRLARQLLARARVLDPPERAQARGKPWLPIYRDMTLAVVFGRAGQTDSARAMAARAQARVGNDKVMKVDLDYELALLELALGNRDRSLALLADYLNARPYLRSLVSRHPRWKPLWDDPRFISLVRPPRE
jgi:tetratricopeptide (TPR) repeat protein